MKLFLKIIVLTAVMALFTACGGSDFEWFPEENIAPIANAGAGQSVVAGAVVTLDGSASSDDNGDDLTYGWSFTSKPAGSTAVLSNSTAVNPTFTADVAGNYLLSLVVNDGAVSSPASSITVTATATTSNTAPAANAGANQSVAAGAVVTLNGSGTDANGDTLTYSWSFTRPAGSTAALSSTTVANPTFTDDVAGIYLLSLIVNDGKVNSPASLVTITATATTSNTAPVANAGANQTVVAGGVVTLSGSGTDANGDTLTNSWSFTKPTGSLAALSSTTVANPTFTADVAGVYLLSLIVSDGKVNSAASTVTITATAATVNLAPVANAGANQTVVAGGVVTLNGSGTDANGDTLTYKWTIDSVPNLGGASTAALSDPAMPKPTFTADLAGDYVLSLIVNDGKVDSEPATVTINATNTPPLANAGADKIVFTGNLVTLDGSGSSDANGDPLTYSWAFTAKPGGTGSVLLSGSTTASPTFTPTVAGVYTLQLTVADRYVNSTDTVTITVTQGTGSITVTW